MSKTRTARHGTKDPAKGLFADNEMIDIAGIFGVLRRRKWSIAAITIAGTVAAYLYGSSVIPIYNAQATLLVEPSDSGVAELDRSASFTVRASLTPSGLPAAHRYSVVIVIASGDRSLTVESAEMTPPA